MNKEAVISDPFEVVVDGDQVMQVSNMSTSNKSLGRLIKAKNTDTSR